MQATAAATAGTEGFLKRLKSAALRRGLVPDHAGNKRRSCEVAISWKTGLVKTSLRDNENGASWNQSRAFQRLITTGNKWYAWPSYNY
ncbi:unnamed protein product [Chondrus crispus]|uniref:Uncharacterized protein n=1 Tax=Chondrus crispus TaxID=2769 RepID=R7QJ99_CHOCR|nr:unnamed protein product [Chondrus crispus]CDF38592.1 unnamed protein product [Chondrus crispus]|eukprot:XP_005718497.1 unnamed protein product [Chondrus crispus]